jgi:hypothetical protein
MAEIFGQTSILWILCVLQNLLQLIGLLQNHLSVVKVICFIDLYVNVSEKYI